MASQIQAVPASLSISAWEDVRLELNNTGHNLTSVLMNPRDTMYDEILEDLWDDLTSDVSTPTSPLSSSSIHGFPSNESLSQHSISGHGIVQNSHLGILNGSSSSSNTGAQVGTGTSVDESMKYIQKNYRLFELQHRAKQRRDGRVSSSTIGAAEYGGAGGLPPPQGVSPAGRGLDTESSSQLNKCYREVPPAFFLSDFSLSQPRLFEEVLNPNNCSGSIQQRKLNEYLDLVEYALLQQIWSRSGDIFSALEDIKYQQEHVNTAITTVDLLRKQLRSADEQVAASAIHIPLMHRRRGNEDKLLAKLTCMQHVLEGRNNVHALLEAGDFLGALGLLAECKQMFLRDLTDIVSMRKVGEQLDAYDGFVCEVISNRFVSSAMELDPDQELDQGGGATALHGRHKDGAGSSILHSLTKGDDEFAESQYTSNSSELSIGQLMQALVRIGHLSSAFDMYKSRLIDGLKLIVKTCVTECMTTDQYSTASNNSTGDSAAGDDALGHGTTASQEQPFAQRIRAMPVETFLSSILICFEHLLVAIQRANRVHEFMSASLDEAAAAAAAAAGGKGGGADDGRQSGSNSADNKPGATSTAGASAGGVLQELSKNCLTSACDIAQRALSQLLLMRKADMARLPLEGIRSLWDTASHFASSVEKINGSSAYIIRQALQTLTVAFLSTVHERAKLRLASALDAEKWVQCDAPTDKQLEIDRLASGKAFLKRSTNSSNGAGAGIAKPITGTELASGVVSGSNANGSGFSTTSGAAAPDAAGASKGGKSKSGSGGREVAPILVDGKPFKVVWPVLLLFEVIMSYLDIAMGFPLITGEIITSTKEVVQLFNKTTLSLVLGSGAQKSQAQLRSISAKHLAVTAQSLGLVITMLPHIRAALLTQLPQNRSVQLTELDRVSQELMDHHSQILTKFVIILGDSIDASVPKLSGLAWDTSVGHVDYFMDLSKNLSALHRVLLLETSMPLEQVQDIFSRIFALIVRKLPAHFEDVMPATKTGRQRIMDEVTHLSAAVSLLQSIKSSSEMALLEEAFRRKYQERR
jgi:vacuolar protein sorting-associated protein 54